MKREYKPLSRCLDNYFNVYLSNVRGASKNTRRAYRDAFMLFFCFLSKHTNTPIDKLTFKEITKDNVLEFLDHLEKDKKNTTKTRNHRFTAIRCYMMQCDPMNMKQWSDIAEIPKKKERKRVIDYLTKEGMDLLLKQPDKMRCLMGRDIILFPDLDATEKWIAKADEIPALRTAIVSTWLSENSTNAEKAQGLDIGDWLVRLPAWRELRLEDFI